MSLRNKLLAAAASISNPVQGVSLTLQLIMIVAITLFWGPNRGQNSAIAQQAACIPVIDHVEFTQEIQAAITRPTLDLKFTR